MKGDVRARLLVRMLEEMPVGFQIGKFESPRTAPDLAEELEAEQGLPVQPVQDWLRELQAVLGPSQEPGFDLSTLDHDLPLPPSPKPEGPVWGISFYDEYGEVYDDLHTELAEDSDLLRALVLAKNRFLARRSG